MSFLHTWPCCHPSPLRSRPSVSRSWTRSWRGYPRCPSETTEAPWRTYMPFTSPTATRGGSITSNRLTEQQEHNLFSSNLHAFNPTDVNVTYNTILVIWHFFFFPVQDVPARPEGGVLVRQPSYRSAHTDSTYCEGRPELQPVPGGARAGAGAARLNPDIIIRQQQNKTKSIRNSSIMTTKKLSSMCKQRTSGKAMYSLSLNVCVCVRVCGVCACVFL